MQDAARGGSARWGRLHPGGRPGIVAACRALAALIVAAPLARAEPADVTVGSVLDAQRERYEAFQRRQQQRYEGFQEERKADYEAFRERMQAAYARYVGIVEEVRRAEEQRVESRWPDGELSSQRVWVEYSDDLEERRRVDFEEGTVTFESLDGELGPDRPEALRARLLSLLTEGRAEAFERDPVSRGVERRVRAEVEELETAEVATTSVLWPWLTGRSRPDPGSLDAMIGLLMARARYETTTVAGETMQQATIPLDPETLLAQLDKLQSGGFAAPMPEVAPQEIPRPRMPGRRDEGAGPSPPSPPRARPPSPPESSERPESPPPRSEPRRDPPPRSDPPPPSSPTPRETDPAEPVLPVRARSFAASVSRHGGERGLDPALVFAIMETESAFNPLARSHVPAYGLMQIVPRSAGLDATAELFGRARLLSPSYLYDPDRNVQIGAIYLDILWSRYLAGVRSPKSRLYCVIAAYNTGAGNVFRTFTGRTRSKAAFEAINAMTPDDVYRKLIWDLPYKETRDYLAKVVRRMGTYRR